MINISHPKTENLIEVGNYLLFLWMYIIWSPLHNLSSVCRHPSQNENGKWMETYWPMYTPFNKVKRKSYSTYFVVFIQKYFTGVPPNQGKQLQYWSWIQGKEMCLLEDLSSRLTWWDFFKALQAKALFLLTNRVRKKV